MNRYSWQPVLICLPLLVLLWDPSCRGSNANSANPSVNQTTNTNSNQNSGVRGLWGGQHINMEIGDAGAEIDYDCAHGRITEKIVPDRNGKFAVKGVHVRERPGPVRLGQENEHAASYEASIDGDTMTLTVTLTANNEEVGTFTLTHGKTGRVVKCK